MSCNYNCKICPRLIISTAVTVVTIGDTDTLVVDLPATTVVGATPYINGCKYCVVIAQAVPTTATINMPVAFSIGGDTTVVYPFLNCDCTQVTACAIQTRTKYPVLISTTATGGVFKTLRKLNCYPASVLATLPAPATAVASAVEVANFARVADIPYGTTTTKQTTTVTTTTKKEIN